MEILNPGTVGDTKHIESPRAATLGLSLYLLLIIYYLMLPAPYIPCVYNDVHFELELSGQLTDAGCPEKGWCAPPHQQKDQSVIYYP